MFPSVEQLQQQLKDANDRKAWAEAAQPTDHDVEIAQIEASLKLARINGGLQRLATLAKGLQQAIADLDECGARQAKARAELQQCTDAVRGAETTLSTTSRDLNALAAELYLDGASADQIREVAPGATFVV